MLCLPHCLSNSWEISQNPKDLLIPVALAESLFLLIIVFTEFCPLFEHVMSASSEGVFLLLLRRLMGVAESILFSFFRIMRKRFLNSSAVGISCLSSNIVATSLAILLRLASP